MFDVYIDMAEIESRFTRALSAIDDGLRRGVFRGATDGAEYAKATKRYKDRTNALSDSIQGKPGIAARGAAEAEIVATAKHARFVEEGTKPHVIEARRAPFLVFKWHGRWVRMKRVNHPGTKPYAFMGDAYLKAERVLWVEIEIALAEAQNILDG